MTMFPKPSKGARLRTKQAALAEEKKTLTAVYKRVYERDGYRCRACSRRVVPNSLMELERAHPHHIVPRSKDKSLVSDEKNVITLCPMCHADRHDGHLKITGTASKLRIFRA